MGKIFKFGQDVDTDQIIASQYIIYPTIDEMKVHTFESLDQAADFITGIVRYSYGKGSLFHIFDVGHKLF